MLTNGEHGDLNDTMDNLEGTHVPVHGPSQVALRGSSWHVGDGVCLLSSQWPWDSQIGRMPELPAVFHPDTLPAGNEQERET